MRKCSGLCKQLLPESEFNKHKKRKDGLQTVCKKCNQQRSERYYQENREKHKNYVSSHRLARIKRIKDFVNNVKHTKGCLVCRENDPDVLDFHHIDPSEKEFTLSRGKRRLGIQKIQQEINKCVVLCSYCHRRLHVGRICLLPIPNKPETQNQKSLPEQIATEIYYRIDGIESHIAKYEDQGVYRFHWIYEVTKIVDDVLNGR
jgi:hypothetical protein